MPATRTTSGTASIRRRRILAAGAAALAAAGLPAGCGSRAKDQAGPPGGLDTAALQADMNALVRAGVPGVAVRVSKGGEAATLTAGVSDVATGARVRPADRFRIGSLAKPYVAAVVMQLVDEGKLSLDDTVEHWLPGMVPNGAQITLRQLLRHQTGIPDYGADPRVLAPYVQGDIGHVWTPKQLVAIAASHPPMFKPGASVRYSNTNYTLAGLIVEKATGSTLGAEMKTRIFEPLGLKDTQFATSGRMSSPYSHGYLLGNGKPVDATTVYPFYWGAGNLVADADDVAKFYDALLGGKLVPARLLSEMKQTVPETPKVAQGLGLVRGQLPCGSYVGHDGSAPGYFSVAYTMEKTGRQMVILMNSVTLNDMVGSPKAQQALGKVAVTAACS